MVWSHKGSGATRVKWLLHDTKFRQELAVPCVLHAGLVGNGARAHTMSAKSCHSSGAVRSRSDWPKRPEWSARLFFGDRLVCSALRHDEHMRIAA